MLDWLNHTTFAHNSLAAWLYAVGGAVVGFLLAVSTLHVVTSRLKKLHLRTARPVRAVMVVLLQGTRRWLLLLLALAIGGEWLESPPRVQILLAHAVFALCGLQLALWANALIRYWLHRNDGQAGVSIVNPIFMNMITWAAQLLIWVTLLLAMFDNVGVNITAFVASLGVGGIAVALALQSILGDLFSSVAIGLDKPFEVGNVIAFGDNIGTVTHVGVKSTRIASLSGEQLVISNSDLLKELVHNYSRMPKRRVVFGFRLPYSTSSAHVQHVVDQVQAFIRAEADTLVRFDRGHLTGFGEYGFDFEFVYYVLSPDYALYRDVQQRVNFRIMGLLESLQVAFAVPVREIVQPGKGAKIAGDAGQCEQTVPPELVEH